MSEPLRALLRASLRDALARLDPARLVHDALPPLPPRRARVRVIAAGKAAVAMAEGALARWPARIEDALAITVDPGADRLHSPSDPRLRIRVAAHPLPDARSVAAAEEALLRAGDLGAEDLLVALISGGASSLLAAPSPGISLELKRSLLATLLDAGAPIRAVNLVRRHLSRVKGGRLAAAALPARVLTLIVSDVIDGALHDIGSGPSVPDPTTVEEARAVLRRYAPEEAALIALDESLKPDAPISLLNLAATFPAAARIRAKILADPAALAQAVAASLERAGLRAQAGAPEEGEASTMVERRLAQARALAPGEALVIACEPTLRLPPTRGRGGRAGWIALAALRDLPEGVALLCAASDGADGSSGGAGALVMREDAARSTSEAID
ncbi:MAG: glycerate-2-kinase family protein, partial [Minicystis sp.]